MKKKTIKSIYSNISYLHQSVFIKADKSILYRIRRNYLNEINRTIYIFILLFEIVHIMYSNHQLANLSNIQITLYLCGSWYFHYSLTFSNLFPLWEDMIRLYRWIKLRNQSLSSHSIVSLFGQSDWFYLKTKPLRLCLDIFDFLAHFPFN